MTKRELTKLFPNFSPKRAFRASDVGFEIVGKYVSALQLDGTGVWDVFVCNVGDMAKGLTGKRTLALFRLFPKNTIAAQLLDGEAYFQADFDTVKQWLEEHRVKLGIRKRRPPPKKSISSIKNLDTEAV
jgi:hypothetical protein